MACKHDSAAKSPIDWSVFTVKTKHSKINAGQPIKTGGLYCDKNCIASWKSLFFCAKPDA